MPAPTFTNLTSGGTATGATSFTTASVAPTGNRLLLVSIHAYIGSGSIEPPAPTVGGNGIRYELIREQQIDTAGTDRATLFVYRGMTASPATGTILLDFGTVTITKIVWSVDQSDANVATGNNGAQAILTSAGSESVSTVTTQPTNFPQTMGAGNSGFFACGMQSTETQTPRASWTELGDVGTINSVCIETQYIAGTDTAGSSSWVTAARAGSIVIEVTPVDSGSVITAATDSPDTYLPDATLLDPATDDGGGDPALGFLYQPSPTQVLDAVGGATNYTQTSTDDTGETDNLADIAAYVRSQTDDTGLTDVPTQVTASNRTQTDDAGLADNQSQVAGYARASTDSAGLTDNISQTAAFSQAPTDSAGLTDSITQAATYVRVITDDTGLTDVMSQAASGSGAQTITDSTGLTDSVTQAVNYNITITDQAGLTDLVVKDFARLLTDLAGLTDTSSRVYTARPTVSDDAGLTDTVVASGSAVTIVVPPFTVTSTDTAAAAVTATDTRAAQVFGTDQTSATVTSSSSPAAAVTATDQATVTVTS
jgi:hypothetical protein